MKYLFSALFFIFLHSLSAESLNLYGYSLVNNLRIRSNSSLTSSILERINENDKFIINYIGKKDTIDGMESFWLNISYGEVRNAFVFGGYCGIGIFSTDAISDELQSYVEDAMRTFEKDYYLFMYDSSYSDESIMLDGKTTQNQGRSISSVDSGSFIIYPVYLRNWEYPYGIQIYTNHKWRIQGSSLGESYNGSVGHRIYIENVNDSVIPLHPNPLEMKFVFDTEDISHSIESNNGEWRDIHIRKTSAYFRCIFYVKHRN